LKETQTPARKYAKGMGKAVADRTVNRRVFNEFKRKTWIKTWVPSNDVEDGVKLWARNNDYEIEKFVITSNGHDNPVAEVKVLVTGKYETEEWEDVARRVALGNSLLVPEPQGVSKSRWNLVKNEEYKSLEHHLRQASVILSGRHLQHGDETQLGRNQEVFLNCSTAATSFMSFLLLMNGSGVGRCYNDAMMLVDWSNLPTVVTVIDQNHPDVLSGEVTCMDYKNAKHLYEHTKQSYFKVPDTREGWAKAVETMELMAYRGDKKNSVLILDFSDVRPRGAPIRGMQDRPASGPAPLINAINNVSRVKYAGMKPWLQTMYVDHFMAECVLVGGARRAARLAAKTWTDPDILEYISVKRGGFLWSANNSVLVDEEFWESVERYQRFLLAPAEIAYSLSTDAKDSQACKIFNAITEAAYNDNTGEPGIINQHKLTQNDTGLEVYKNTGEFIGSKKYQLEPETKELAKKLAEAMLGQSYNMIVNPCAEIALLMVAGYCCVGDVVLYHAQNDNDAEDACRVTTRALMRTNTMDCLYRPEVDRTNRIGVGLTGLHEYAWKRFGYGWKDLIDESKSKDFWLMLARFKRAVADECEKYAEILGVTVPHTNTTIKPSGTVSKMFGLTEGAHLPAMREYIRWVQFRNDDPLVKQYRELGYPVKKLQVYAGTTIVGFPTRPEICKLGMGDKLLTASEASMEEQYKWLQLLEKYWIQGVEEDGVTPLKETGNQISYTLKYNPKETSFEEFKAMVSKYQPLVRCCSVMPQQDDTAYEYTPESAVTKHEYEQIMQAIKDDEMKEDVDFVHIDCSSGSCPIDFNKSQVSEQVSV
jgi:ribonucleoside-triphosphate reductase (formate)